MNSIRSRTRWILPTLAALLSTCAIADIPSAANECVSDLLQTPPSSDFTALEGGTVVRHKPTGLEWRRCAEGMTWTGTGCSGLPGLYTWQGALLRADATSGWRLPNVKELRSIVERCGPAVNRQVFPDTPSGGFWSASPAFGVANNAWAGDARIQKRNERHVRLVRGGQ